MQNVDMLTPYGEKVNLERILQEYPRPQLQRDSYFNLNGVWDYAITTSEEIPSNFLGKIVVPFPVESILSGVKHLLRENEYLFYKKEFSLENFVILDYVFLHFMAVDQICDVFINHHHVCHHEGGYLPFQMDIKPYLEKKNTLIVRVKDALDTKYPYGKQKKNRGGMWYTPISGIWQTVFLESVSNDYVKELTITPNFDQKSVCITCLSSSNDYHLIIEDPQGQIVYEANNTIGYFDVQFSQIMEWSPKSPNLYSITIRTRMDCIHSYFGFRKFSVDQNNILLNNKPFFIHALLDQGYFSDGIYTPASYEAYEEDLKYIKSLGFNAIRKHIKIEPLYFYYLCDKLGILVLQDFVNNSSYHFIKDTILPTLGVKKLQDHSRFIPKENKKIFIQSVEETIHHLYNVVSIGYYTIFNEGWGQFDADKLYRIVSSIDPTRIIDTTSGWFKQNDSDVESEHIYFKKIKIKKKNRPIIISEFGGYSYKSNGHCYNVNKTYGYRFFKDKMFFVQAFKKLYECEILPIKNEIAGCVYTQLSDVEDETNGLISYDRKEKKIQVEDVKELFKQLTEVNKDD